MQSQRNSHGESTFNPRQVKPSPLPRNSIVVAPPVRLSGRAGRPHLTPSTSARATLPFATSLVLVAFYTWHLSESPRVVSVSPLPDYTSRESDNECGWVRLSVARLHRLSMPSHRSHRKRIAGNPPERPPVRVHDHMGDAKVWPKKDALLLRECFIYAASGLDRAPPSCR